MFEVRVHGRGGQGVVTAAEILSIAAFLDGKESQAFPSFGSERMGAPVTAFCRVSDRPIRLREPIMCPNAIVVQDPTLLTNPDLFSGLTDNGFVIINTHHDIDHLGVGAVLSHLPAQHVLTVAATDIARKHFGRPLPNAALLGGLIAMTKVVSLESLKRAIERKLSGEIGKKNAAAAEEAFGVVLAMLDPKAPAGSAAEPVVAGK